MTYKAQEHEYASRAQVMLVKPREDPVTRVHVQYIEAYQTDCAAAVSEPRGQSILFRLDYEEN